MVEEWFRNDRARMGPGGAIAETNVPVMVSSDINEHIKISQEDIHRAWEGAFRIMIEVAETYIGGIIARDLVQFLNTTPLVVLSGGTLKNQPLAAALSQIVEASGLGEPQLISMQGGDEQ